MKTSHSLVFFVIMLLVVAAVFFLFNQKKDQAPQILLQTMDCQSDKVDSSVYQLAGNTSLIGAYITFSKTSLSDADKAKLYDLGVAVDYNTFIFDYAYAEIPSDSLCGLVAEDLVVKIFIPEENTNFNL